MKAKVLFGLVFKLFFRFSWFAHLIFRQAEKQDNSCFPFTKLASAKTVKHVGTCGADIPFEVIPQCRRLKFPCFWKWVRSAVMTLSSECSMIRRRQGTENKISWKLLEGGPLCFQRKGLVYVASRWCWAMLLLLAWAGQKLLFLFFSVL